MPVFGRGSLPLLKLDVGCHSMGNRADKKPSIHCPRCGSTNVRREIFRRINIGCLLVNVLGLVTLVELPGLWARVCRECGNRFVD